MPPKGTAGPSNVCMFTHKVPAWISGSRRMGPLWMLGLGDIVGLVVLYVSVTGLMGANCGASLLKLFPANAGAVLYYVWLRVRAGEGRAVRPPEPAHRP